MSQGKLNERSALEACATTGFFRYPQGEGKSGIVPLDGTQMHRLVDDGMLAFSELEADRYQREDAERLLGRICLVYNQDLDELWNLIDYPDPDPSDLIRTVKGMYLSFCGPRGLTLLSSRNLYTLLPRYRSIATYGIRKVELGKRERFAYSRVQSSREYCGRYWVCDFENQGIVCGEPGCGSNLCWRENALVLLHFSMGGEGISVANIYPLVSVLRSYE